MKPGGVSGLNLFSHQFLSRFSERCTLRNSHNFPAALIKRSGVMFCCQDPVLLSLWHNQRLVDSPSYYVCVISIWGVAQLTVNHYCVYLAPMTIY